jgi:DNA-binding GntR family transcriptional regulator
VEELQKPAITATDKTFIRLRDEIVEGFIPAGTKLSELELSTKYEVSRAVIRESLNRLETCYLVERKANVGARVVTLSAEGLVELYQVRESLEGMAARLAARNMSKFITSSACIACSWAWLARESAPRLKNINTSCKQSITVTKS